MKTPEQINDLRKRVLAGEDVSPDEYREIIQAYRAQRLGAVTASAPKTTAPAASAKSAAPIDLNALMAGIGLGKSS